MVNDKKVKQQPNNQTNANESSLSRLSKIPIVELALYVSLSVYNKVKSSSELVNNVLNGAEKMAFSTLDNLKPITNKFESQVKTLDSFGNTCLDKLEQVAPSLTTFNPKNAYANLANRWLSLKRSVTDRYNVARNFNLNKKFSNGLKSVDDLVDNYLPGTEEELNEQKDDGSDTTLVHQTVGIFSKLRRRTVQRLQNVQRLVL